MKYMFMLMFCVFSLCGAANWRHYNEWHHASEENEVMKVHHFLHTIILYGCAGVEKVQFEMFLSNGSGSRISEDSGAVSIKIRFYNNKSEFKDVDNINIVFLDKDHNEIIQQEHPFVGDPLIFNASSQDNFQRAHFKNGKKTSFGAQNTFSMCDISKIKYFKLIYE